MSGEIVPFGKYKDQPVEVLLADQQYVGWLLNQPWLKDAKFQAIYNTIVNFTSPPEDTPEHNAMQARFLVPIVRRSLYAFMMFRETDPDEATMSARDCPFRFEFNGWDVALSPADYYNSDAKGVAVEIKPSVGDDFPAILRQINARKPVLYSPRPYNIGTWNPKYRVLYTDKFTCSNLTLEQVREMFKHSGVTLVLSSEITDFVVGNESRLRSFLLDE
jgi:hypothetical protein